MFSTLQTHLPLTSIPKEKFWMQKEIKKIVHYCMSLSPFVLYQVLFAMHSLLSWPKKHAFCLKLWMHLWLHQLGFSAERDAVSQQSTRHQERELLSDFQPVVYSLQGLHELFLKGPGKTTKASRNSHSIRKFFETYWKKIKDIVQGWRQSRKVHEPT